MIKIIYIWFFHYFFLLEGIFGVNITDLVNQNFCDKSVLDR